MNIRTFASASEANDAAADLLGSWLSDSTVRNVMLAAGNTPLDLYSKIAQRGYELGHLCIFALDEYVGVPLDEPRNCANLIRRSAVEPWGVSGSNYFTVSSLEQDAAESLRAHEAKIHATGGLDVVVLGLGQNGHLGFNEPGSSEHSTARVLDLDPISIEANRKWFDNKYAPARGATTGLRDVLAARRILLLAYGPHKVEAVRAMTQGPRSSACPASFLQGLPEVHVFLDAAAARGLSDA